MPMTELHTPSSGETILFLFILALPWLVGIAVAVSLVIFLLKKIPQPYSKWTTVFVVTLICSVVIVFQTIGLPKTINDPTQLKNITCGWPMPFFMFESTREPAAYALTDNCIGWAGSPMDTEKHILWVPLLTNITLVSIIIGMFFILVAKVITNAKLNYASGKQKSDTKKT